MSISLTELLSGPHCRQPSTLRSQRAISSAASCGTYQASAAFAVRKSATIRSRSSSGDLRPARAALGCTRSTAIGTPQIRCREMHQSGRDWRPCSKCALCPMPGPTSTVFDLGQRRTCRKVAGGPRRLESFPVERSRSALAAQDDNFFFRRRRFRSSEQTGFPPVIGVSMSNEPLLGRAEDDGVMAAPAMRIGMIEISACPKSALRETSPAPMIGAFVRFEHGLALERPRPYGPREDHRRLRWRPASSTYWSLWSRP